MERCAVTLEDFIHCGFKEKLGLNRYYKRIDEDDDLRILCFLSIVKDVAAGINFIHNLDEVHRDLKPTNGNIASGTLLTQIVLLSLEHYAWQVADFGFAVQGTSSVARVTDYGMGTPGYRPPEETRNQKERVFCKQSDIFSLGCVFYELANGIHAFPDGDWGVWNYCSKPSIFKVGDAEMDQHTRTYIGSIVNAMLQVDWWRRPSIQVVYPALSDIDTSSVASIQDRNHILWKPHWYISVCLKH